MLPHHGQGWIFVFLDLWFLMVFENQKKINFAQIMVF